MPINARPNLEDNFFKQQDDSVLTLSGHTRIATTSGLTITNGSGAYIPLILTGGTSGNTWTYINGQMVLRPSGAGATPLFNSVRPTTRPGVPVVNVGGSTVQQFLEGYFFPSVGPSSSLSVFTGGSDREFGNIATGNLAWDVVKNTNTISQISLSSNGIGTFNCSITPTGISQSGASPYVFPTSAATPTTACTNTVIGFILSAKTTSGETTTSNATIMWRNKNFYFANPTIYTGSTINAVLSGETGFLATNKNLSITMTFNNEFFYYAYPKIYGLPSFIVNGLPNNAWGGSAEYAPCSFTTLFINTQGYLNEYFVARSDNKITGTYTIVVT